ncbi:MAG: preprotein translocase subunit SecG [Bacteroidia bacterium]|nr:preprotein translocase subunit SecG [Bacteroidia bacterium]
MIGAKKTTDILERITWGLAGGLIVLTLFTNFFVESDRGTTPVSPNVEKAQDQRTVNPGLQPNTTQPSNQQNQPNQNDVANPGDSAQ